jgi:hypothetical protein
MQNRKIIQAAGAAALLILGATGAFAHNGIEHVMGTLSAKSDTSVTVETPKHAKVTVLLDRGTTFSFNDKAVTLNDLKPGERVVVNAKEDSSDKLHAVSIRWGANSSSHADHDQPKQ